MLFVKNIKMLLNIPSRFGLTTNNLLHVLWVILIANITILNYDSMSLLFKKNGKSMNQDQVIRCTVVDLSFQNSISSSAFMIEDSNLMAGEGGSGVF